MRNYIPWTPDVIPAIFENYEYDPFGGTITSKKRPTAPLGTPNAGGLQLFMYMGGKAKGLAAHRVAVLLHTGKQPDSVWFADGNRSNLKWDNLRYSNAEFPATPAGSNSEEVKFHMSIIEMDHIQALREALRVGGYRDDEALPDYSKMSAVQLLRWAKTNRHHSIGSDNPKNYLDAATWASRYGDSLLRVELPAKLTPADAPVEQVKVKPLVQAQTKQLKWRNDLMFMKKNGIPMNPVGKQNIIETSKFLEDDGSGVTLDDMITSILG
jgi:hypothetical protein